MPPTSGKGTWYVLKAESVSRSPQPEFVVHNVVQVSIEISQPVKYAATKKDIGLRKIVQPAQHDFPIEFNFLLCEQYLSRLVNDQVVAIDKVNAVISVQSLDNFGKAARLITIIGIYPPNDLACSHLK